RKSVPKRAARPQPSEPAQVSTYSGDSRLLRFALRGTGFLLLAVAAWAWWHPELRVWGVHSLAFLPKEAAAAMLLLAAALWSPLGPRLARFLGDRLAPLTGRSALWYALAAALLFFGLRVSVPLLGDGPLWIKELAWIGEFEAHGKSVPWQRILTRKEPLELGVHEWVFRAAAAISPPGPSAESSGRTSAAPSLQPSFHRMAHLDYACLSIVAGAIFVWMLVRFTRRRLELRARAPFLLTMFSGGGMLLFFGYIENYTWASLTITACLLAALSDAFPPRRFPWRTLATFAVAVAFHLMALMLLPAVAYLLYSLHVSGRAAPKRARLPMTRPMIFIIATLVVAMAGYLYVKGWKGWMSIIPLLPHWSHDGYALLSLRHALDLVNLLALTALPALLILIFSRASRDDLPHERIQLGFLRVAAFGSALFVSLFSPNLGMARDWDLFAAALWPVLVLAAWTIARWDFGERRAEILAGVTGFLMVVSIPFILVSVLRSPSLARYETLLQIDRSRSAYGWENLAIYFESVGDVENDIRAWRNAVDVSDNPRYQINLAIALRVAGRLDEAEGYALFGARKLPQFAYQLAYLASAFLRDNRPGKARELLAVAAELDSSNAQIRQMRLAVDRQLGIGEPPP
ncbi:MAG: tetratricopeptide repeat protein, partial [bacterium]|nr:tetratricopeptide repeat protein [bacterium]